MKISRKQFEENAGNLIAKVEEILKGLQNTSGKQVTHVLFTGKGCQMPWFKRVVNNIFGKVTITNLYDDSVAKGAARYALQLYYRKQTNFPDLIYP